MNGNCKLPESVSGFVCDRPVTDQIHDPAQHDRTLDIGRRVEPNRDQKSHINRTEYAASGRGSVCVLQSLCSLSNPTALSTVSPLFTATTQLFCPHPPPQRVEIELRRKQTCRTESQVHYKSPVKQTTRGEGARKTHALYCVLVGVSGLDKQPSVR